MSDYSAYSGLFLFCLDNVVNIFRLDVRGKGYFLFPLFWCFVFACFLFFWVCLGFFFFVCSLFWIHFMTGNAVCLVVMKRNICALVY